MALDFAAKLRRLENAGPESRALAPIETATSGVHLTPALSPGGRGGLAANSPPPEGWRTSAASSADTNSREARIAELRARLDAFLVRSRAELPRRVKREAPPLPGRAVATAHGEMHVVDHVLPPDHCHGRTEIARATRVDGDSLAALALDDRLAAIDARKLLLLDTETTGLSGGTGSLAFLIGLAWFEDESLVVRQLLLRRPGQEAPMLHALREKLDGASALVTFNGKSFDWPLLRTRFVMNRVGLARDPERHLDLLHCARRVFGRRLDGVRLTALEEAVLGMRRERDIDGAEIPGAYLSYIRGNDDGTMARVLEHNLHDLVALAALVVALADRWSGASAADDPRDQISLARVAIRAKDDARAVAFAEAAAEGAPASGPDGALSSEALRLVALLARRRGDPRAAGEALGRALEASPHDPEVHLALAKHYEHHVRDLGRALEHARFAARAEGEAENAIRVARLEKRLARRSERSTKRVTLGA